MDNRNLANQAIQIESKAIEAFGKGVEALLELLKQECSSERDKAVLGSFQNHKLAGGDLYRCPINADRMDEFEKTAQSMGLTYTTIREKRNPDVISVIYMDKEDCILSKVVDELTKDGRALIDDMEIPFNKLVDEYLGDSSLDKTFGFKTKEDVAMFKTSANANKLTYSLIKDDEGEFAIMTASRDFEKLRKVDGWLGLQTTHMRDERSMKEIIAEATKEREAEERGQRNKSRINERRR